MLHRINLVLTRNRLRLSRGQVGRRPRCAAACHPRANVGDRRI